VFLEKLKNLIVEKSGKNPRMAIDNGKLCHLAQIKKP
jgi:hypothetical protein